MNVLIACEFSGIVREAFRQRGHNAWSCDLLLTEIPSDHHFIRSIHALLDECAFGHWNLMVAFPPCTHLASSGARWFKDKAKEQEMAVEFVRQLGERKDIARIAIENPVGVLSSKWRKPDQIIQPWMFGHGETKATCLWLKNLPPLKPTNIVEGRKPRVHLESPGSDRWKRRSIMYQGIADAMAEQWGVMDDI
jgi:hypothetical protein